MTDENIETTAEGGQEGSKPKPPEFKKPLDRMTAIELREVALGIPGISGVHAMKKEELLPLIKEYYGIEDEAARGKKKAGKSTATVQELKAKIRQLRGKKKEVRGAKNRKQADIMRRRINRLKKQTRKAAQG